MYTYSFEKLEVWIEAKELSKQVYLITKAFPDDEKFGLHWDDPAFIKAERLVV